MGRERRFIFDPPKLRLPIIRPLGTRSRGLRARAQRSTRVLAKAPNERPQRSALRNRFASVEPMTVGAVPLAAGRAATFRPAVQPAALFAFRRRLLAGRPGSRSGQATLRQAQR